MIKNPIIRGFNPDPSICLAGDDFYIATSTFEWYPGVQIHHSRDLVHWRLLTHALTDPRLIDLRGVPSSGGIWAPALSHDNGTFYLCYTIVQQHESVTKDTPNYLTTAESIEGPWSTPSFINASGFDPSLFHDDNGRKYWLNMVWDHRPGRHPFYGISIQEWDAEQGRLLGEPKIIFEGSRLGYTEGPHLYKRKKWYYLITAEGGTGYDHAVTIARSRDVAGPYELHPRNPILTSKGLPESHLQKAGHGSLVSTTSEEWYLAHLCSRPLPGSGRCNLGRETAIQRIEWQEDDWPDLSHGNSHPLQIVESPDLPEHRWPSLPKRVPFESVHYAIPRGPTSKVVRHPDCLELKGAGSLESCFEQAMLARRLDCHELTATTCLHFEPKSFQQQAGLAAYYNNHLFHYLYLSRDEDLGPCLQIHSCDDGASTFPLGPNVAATPHSKLFLRLVIAGKDLQFYWSVDGVDFQTIGPVLDASILSDDYGKYWGFTGTFIALACQDLTGAGLSAKFEFLEFTEPDNETLPCNSAT